MVVGSGEGVGLSCDKVTTIVGRFKALNGVGEGVGILVGVGVRVGIGVGVGDGVGVDVGITAQLFKSARITLT